LLGYIDKNYNEKIKPLIFTIDNMKKTRNLANSIYNDWLNLT